MSDHTPAPPPPQAMIEVESLSKAFDRELAVDDLSFVVRAGEVAGLVGPNGAGKTTTLRALAGVMRPTQGVVRIATHDMLKDTIAAKKALALVPHDPSLFGALTVWEHIEFTAKIYGVSDYEDKARTLLERFHLDSKVDAMGDELSRGMQQKVALICSFLHDPRVYLMDEPLTGLDPHAIRTVFEMIGERAREGAAVIISSHLLDQVERTCSTFIILAQGKLLFRGTKAEIQATLPDLRADASLEELFFQATEGTKVIP